jgi:hypothetical protein
MAAPDWTEFTARRTFLRSWRLARVGALWDRQTRLRRSPMLAMPSLNGLRVAVCSSPFKTVVAPVRCRRRDGQRIGRPDRTVV